MGGANNPYIKGGGYIFSGEVDVGCVGPMFVAMIVFCWCLDLFFSTVEEKVLPRPSGHLRAASGPSRARPVVCPSCPPAGLFNQPSLRRSNTAQPTP